MANPYLFLIRCLFLSIFNDKSSKIAFLDLINKFSYRYSQSDATSNRSAFRYLKSSINLLFKENNSNSNASSTIFSFGGAISTHAGWKEYLELNGVSNATFVFRDNLYNELNIFSKIINSFYLLFLSFFIFSISILKKDKSKVGLILFELTELLLLFKILGKGKCKELYIVSAFEKDIVFICYFLKKKLNLKINIIPSSNPITFFYKNVICDTFIFTAPFQKNEYFNLKANWECNNTLNWPPYGFNLVKRNLERALDNSKFNIGFMSSGMALRSYLGHTNVVNNNDYNAEVSLIESLNKIQLESDLINKIIVYLHPLEKSNDKNLEFSKQFYEKNLKSIDFAPLELPSKKCFDLCEIAVSGFSSVQIERLYGGYKTIFAPMGYLENYFSDSRLDKISAQNYSELKNMIEKIGVIDSELFYQEYGLFDYRWDAYKV
jgi:hypothetical protein